jgi:hypothetical protein
MRSGIFLVLDHLLCPKELAVVAQVLVELLGSVCGRMGARMLFKLPTTRKMTYTVVAAAAGSSLW